MFKPGKDKKKMTIFVFELLYHANMKKLLLTFACLAAFIYAYGSDSLMVFYRIRMDRDIDKAAQRMLVDGLAKAEESGADYVLLDLNKPYKP